MKLRKKQLITIGFIALMIAFLALLGCAPRQADPNASASGTSASSDDSGSTAAVAWSPESDCATCHSAAEGSLADTTTLAGMHVGQEVDCTTCHDDTTTLTTVHADAPEGPSTAKRLKKTEVVPQTCTASACHADEDARIAATASNTELTDSNGTVVNPHDLPDSGDHAKITCSNCHTGHKAMNAKSTCVSCHHQNVFQCGTCHE